MIQFAIRTALAVLTPVRRGLMYAEGSLLHLERKLRRGTGALFIVLAGLSLVGCGGVEKHARTALDVSAHALIATDAIVADVYTTRAHDALDAATSLDDYRARMSRMDATEAALRTTYETLRTAEATLDATGADGIPGALACVVIAMQHLQAAIVDAGIDMPSSIVHALDLVTAIGSGSCGGAR